MDQLGKDPLMWDEVDDCVTFSPKPYKDTDPENPEEDTPPPRISVSRIKKSAGKFVDKLAGHVGNELKGNEWFDFIEDICKTISYPLFKKKAVIDSFQEYQGLTLNIQLLWRICFRLRSNLDILKQEMAIPAWEPGKKTVWVPVHVVDAERVDLKKGVQLMRIHVLILDGRPAGTLITQQLPVKYVRYYFLKEIGFPKFDDVSEWEVFNTMFMAQIGKTAAKNTAMLKFHVNSAQRKHNSSLHRNRNECPRNMMWFCDRCPLGLDQCPYAVRRHSWEVMDCVNGHKGYFRKKRDGTYGDMCVSCLSLHKKKGN